MVVLAAVSGSDSVDEQNRNAVDGVSKSEFGIMMAKVTAMVMVMMMVVMMVMVVVMVMVMMVVVMVMVMTVMTNLQGAMLSPVRQPSLLKQSASKQFPANSSTAPL